MQLHALREFFSYKEHWDRHIFRDVFAVSSVVTAVVSGDHDGVSIMDGFVDLLDAGKCIVYLVHIFRCHPAVVVTAFVVCFHQIQIHKIRLFPGNQGKGFLREQ